VLMPQDSSSVIQMFGFFLFLSGATLILIRMTLALTRGNARRLRFAAEILLILSVIFWFTQTALTFAGLETWIETTSNEQLRVQKALKEAKRVKNGTHVLMRICQGLCGAHGLPTEAELAALENIARLLDEDIDIANLLAEGVET